MAAGAVTTSDRIAIAHVSITALMSAAPLANPLRTVIVAVALATLACAGSRWPRLPPGQTAPTNVTVTQVPLNPEDPGRDRVGTLLYAGGLQLTSPDDSGFHDLSDLEVSADGQLVAVGDKGQLVHARLVLDAHGRLIGLTGLRATRLTGLDGQPLGDKNESDAEGLAVLANGDMLVSFEQQHRVWRYPRGGGRPVAAHAPLVVFPANAGMEALAAEPDRGPTAYLVGGEQSGQTWHCDLKTACVAGGMIVKADTAGLVAIRPLPGGRRAWLLRSAIQGNSRITNAITLRITDPAGRTIDEQELEPPLTVDNFEGLAAVARPGGRIRFYLVSDDNTPTKTQRVLLLAFDWQP